MTGTAVRHSARRAPQVTRLTSRRGSPPSRLPRKKRRHSRPTSLVICKRSSNKSRSSSPPSPCNMYVGDNFTVRLHKYFKLCQLVQNEQITGVICTEYDPFRNVGSMMLSREAQRIKNVPNAGGTSVISEVMSYEVLRRCFGATLLKTEMEVSYFPEGGSITDYTISMFGTTLGVSVTRAMKYRGEFTQEDAIKLLNKKLNGIMQATRNSLERWAKQILHVWATSEHVAKVITEAFDSSIQDITKANTVVLVTMASNSHELFFEKKK